MNIWGIKITIVVTLFVGPVVAGIAIEYGGKIKAFAGMSNGGATKGISKCLNCDDQKFGSSPVRDSATESFEEVDLIPGPVVGSITHDGRGNVETGLGLAGEISDPTHSLGLQVAATTPTFSSNTAKLREAARRNLSLAERYEILKGNKSKPGVSIPAYRFQSFPKPLSNTAFPHSATPWVGGKEPCCKQWKPTVKNSR